MDIENALISFFGGSAGAAVVILLAKTTIEERIKGAIRHDYDLKLEAHKAVIQAENNATLERLKAELNIAAADHNVRYSRVFERQALIVSEIYAKLIVLQRAVGAYIHPISDQSTPPLADRRKVVNQTFNEFRGVFEPGRLFLSKGTAKRIQEYYDEIFKVTFEFMHTVESDMGRSKPKNQHWMEALDKVNKDIVPLLTKLEDDFRQQLGISDASK